MDLSQLASSETPMPLILLNPSTYEELENDKGEKMIIRVWGPDSDVMREAERKLSATMLKKMSKKGRITTSLTAEELQEQQDARILAAIEGWAGLTMNGKEFKVTDENKRAIVNDAPKFGWIKQQISEFMGDRGNFLTMH